MGFHAGFSIASFTNNRDIIVDKVIENFSESGQEIAEKAVEWVQEQMLYGYSKPPIDTGATFDSISASVSRSSQNAFSVEVGAGTSYAGYVHNGTYKMAARPFIRDGLAAHVDDMASIVGAKLKAGF